jgi:hypothetical protein
MTLRDLALSANVLTEFELEREMWDSVRKHALLWNFRDSAKHHRARVADLNGIL